MTIAYDIETCPLPLEGFSERQMRRYRMDLTRETAKKPDADHDDLSRFVRSVNPHLGWVCCIAVARFDEDAPGYIRTHSWYAADPAREAAMMIAFWSAIQSSANRPDHVVTFNGKSFDAPFLTVRAIAGKVQLPPVARVVLNTHRWRDQPHTDLAHVAHPVRMGLADLCDLCGVETPKGDISGADVAGCVERGEAGRVREYCMADTRATLDCYAHLGELCAL